MDWVVQKAVELGVAEIIPFISRFTVVRLNAKQEQARGQRWERIAQEAAKQCGRTKLPDIRPIHNWEQLVSAVEERVGRRELVLLAYEGEANKGVGGHCSYARCSFGLDWAGRGGFAGAEVERLTEAGAETISLGPRILRTETAGGLAALSLIGYRWGGDLK